MRSADDLLGLYDLAFVEEAYLLMLRRAPDPSGQAYYLRRLRAGYSQISVLDQLWKAPDADPAWSEVLGLRERMDAYRKARRSILGWWQLRTNRDWGVSRRLKSARALENAIARVRQETVAACTEISAEQEVLRNLISNLIEAGVGSERREATQRVTEIHRLRSRTPYDVREFDLPPAGRTVMNSLRI